VHVFVFVVVGNKQSPGSFVLVMTPSWLSREVWGSDIKQQTLHVLKGVTGDRGGAYLDLFEPPRKVTCFVELKGNNIYNNNLFSAHTSIKMFTALSSPNSSYD
jgi:hypothetical protein